MRAPVSQAIQYYAGQRPDFVLGEDEYRAHDATQSWADNGDNSATLDELIQRALESMREQVSAEMNAYGAEQVKQAVMDYVGNGYGDIAAIDGRLCFVFDASSQAAPFRACWNLQTMITNAIRDAEGKGDVPTLQSLQQFIGTLANSFRAPVAAPAATRTQQGRVAPTKPAGGRLGARPR